MRYRNTKTGVVIDIPSTLSGGDWVPVEDSKAEGTPSPSEKASEVPVATPKIDEISEDTPASGDSSDYDGITKKEIAQELEAMGVEYKPSDSKKALYDLMMKGQ